MTRASRWDRQAAGPQPLRGCRTTLALFGAGAALLAVAAVFARRVVGRRGR